MIEKTYGRPAIADVVGYKTIPDHPSETIMQARIEGVMVEIPVDTLRNGLILENNPPGSKISVYFYNCEWHIDSHANSLGNSRPRIGISISELLKDSDTQTFGYDAETSAQDINSDSEAEMPEGYIQNTQDYINEVAFEFKVEAEELLKSIKLSHMQKDN
jgi:hypothetical protein